MNTRQATIYCAASERIHPKYNQAARQLARALHQRGYTLVSGGGKVGTMGAITDESVRCGGRHIAVLPRFMEGLENPAVSQVLWTDTMAERKEKMREGSSVAIALPGGIGTLDELMETHVLRKLGRFTGPVLALNLDGFYDPLIALLDHYVATGATTRADADLLQFPRTVEELLALLDA